MTSKLARALVTLVMGALLAACSGSTMATLPSAAIVSGAKAVPVAHRTPSPCAMPHGWTFRGPCDLFNLPSYPPMTITLGAYHGLTVETKFLGQESNDRPLVLGLGTSDNDITGKITTYFPLYGTNGGCTDFYGNATKCKGKGFVYELIMNPPSSKYSIGITNSPTFRITNTGSYPGSKCQQATLSATNGKWTWSELPQVAPVKKGVVEFASFQWILALQPGFFAVEAFHCF